MDGARFWNACVATGISESAYAEPFDTLSVCFSKGLGAPVGSALVGTAAQVVQARRFRKMFGGGMRQAGIIAAGALYALQHQRDRLADDHENAQRLAQRLQGMKNVVIDPTTVETNIVNFEVSGQSSGRGGERSGSAGRSCLGNWPSADSRGDKSDGDAEQIDQAVEAIALTMGRAALVSG